MTSIPSSALAQSARSVCDLPRGCPSSPCPGTRRRLGGKIRFHERQVAAHVEDLVKVLNVHRAVLVARLASFLFAGPAHLGVARVRHIALAVTVLDRSRGRESWPQLRSFRSLPSPRILRRPISRGSTTCEWACPGQGRLQRPHMVPACRIRAPVPGEVLDHRSTKLLVSNTVPSSSASPSWRPSDGPCPTGTCSAAR